MLLHTIVEPLQIHLAKGCCTNLLVFVASMLCRYIGFVGQSHSAQKIHTAAQCQSMKNISRYLVFFCSPLPCLRLQPSWKVCGSTGCVSSQALMLVSGMFWAPNCWCWIHIVQDLKTCFQRIAKFDVNDYAIVCELSAISFLKKLVSESYNVRLCSWTTLQVCVNSFYCCITDWMQEL